MVCFCFEVTCSNAHSWLYVYKAHEANALPSILYYYSSPLPKIFYPLIWHMGCFQIMVIMNNSAINRGMHFSFQIHFYVLRLDAKESPMSHMVVLFSILGKSFVIAFHRGLVNSPTFFVLFWGHMCRCSGLIPGSLCRDHSWQNSGGYK